MTPSDPSSVWDLMYRDTRTVLHHAAADLLERGLMDELGALRLTLLRVMAEERDLVKLVTSVARLTAVAAQVLRIERARAGLDADTDTLDTTAKLIKEALGALEE